MYIKEGGEYGEDLAGVITVTTEILRELVAITGPVNVGGLVFTKDNAVNELQKQVEITFWEAGIPVHERKDIVGDVAQILQNRVSSFSFKDNFRLLEAGANLVKTRHFVFYFENDKLQKLVSAYGADGRLLPYEGDTLAIVDANLAGFKTEPFMNKTYDYKVSRDGNKLVANLTVRYENRATFTSPLVSNYRTYVRVYVPLGSKLLRNSGSQTLVDVGQELDRSVFGALIVVPIGDERTLQFTYELPNGTYSEEGNSLQVLKQIGAYPANLRIDINFDNVSKSISDKLDTNKTHQF